MGVGVVVGVTVLVPMASLVCVLLVTGATVVVAFEFCLLRSSKAAMARTRVAIGGSSL